MREYKIQIVRGFLLLFLFGGTGMNLHGQTLMAGSTDLDVPATTITNDTWSGVDSVTLSSLSGANSVMVIANFEMQVPIDENADVIGYYRLKEGATVSPEISRYVIGKTYNDIGMGATVNIFSYSNFTGSKTFALQHKRIVPGNSKNISSKANIVALVLDDASVSLPSAVVSTADETTASASNVEIPGSLTGAITLPYTSCIYLCATFSTYSDVTNEGSWVIRSSPDGIVFTDIPNASISRSNSANIGAASITTLLEDQAPGTYYFDVAHRVSSGTGNLTTSNLTLVAVGLSESNGNIYPCFKSLGGSNNTTSSSAVTAVSTAPEISENAGNSMFIHTNFNMSSTATIDVPGFSLGVTNATFTPISFERFLYGASTGSGGLVGLATGIASGDTSVISLNHYSDGTNTLTTNNVNIVGFQLTSSPAWSSTAATNDWGTAGNWNNGAVPASYNNVHITTGTPLISSTTSADCKTLAVNGGALSVNSDATNSGSLVVTDTSSGNITYNRYITGGTYWHMVATPVEGQDIWAFSQAGGNSIAYKNLRWAINTFNEGTDLWNAYLTSDPTLSFSPGTGYNMLRATSGTVSFTGTIRNTDLTAIPITRTLYGWNLLGNPYPSAINATTAADAANTLLSPGNVSNLDPNYAALYLWDHSSSTYLTINNSGGTPPGTLSQDYIQAGQGFFVRAITGGGTFDITRAMQSHQPNASMLKSGRTPWPGINLVAESGEKSSSTFITFGEGMTRGLDISYDAGMNKTDPNFALYSRLVEDNGVDFAIQSLPLSDESVVIPVGLDAEIGTTVTLRAETDHWPGNGTFYLEDRDAHKMVGLGPGETYQFVVNYNNTSPGNFFLRTNLDITGIEEVIEPGGSFTIIANRAEGVIRIMGRVEQDTRVRVIDLSGRVRLDQSLGNTYENSITAGSMEGGIYLVQLYNNHQLFGKKIYW